MTVRRAVSSITTIAGLLLTAGTIAAQSQPAAPPPRPQAPPAPPDVAAPPPDAQKTSSGLAHKLLQAGKSDTHPGPTDTVTVLYTGWTTDGKAFDSSAFRNNQPSTFRLNGVIAGWGEGVQLMAAGEKRRFWIPEALAYRGAQGRPQGMLVFDVELMSFQPSPPSPTTAPSDVAAPPGDVKRTSSGLAYKVLKAGAGSTHPSQFSRVTVHYTGWTTDGKMFDSSVTSGRPATFGLDQVIKGWTEGVQLMVEGEKTRFWIPQNLAYQGQPGAPRGMLVFDVELLKIER